MQSPLGCQASSFSLDLYLNSHGSSYPANLSRCGVNSLPCDRSRTKSLRLNFSMFMFGIIEEGSDDYVYPSLHIGQRIELSVDIEPTYCRGRDATLLDRLLVDLHEPAQALTAARRCRLISLSTGDPADLALNQRDIGPDVASVCVSSARGGRDSTTISLSDEVLLIKGASFIGPKFGHPTTNRRTLRANDDDTCAVSRGLATHVWRLQVRRHCTAEVHVHPSSEWHPLHQRWPSRLYVLER